MNDSIACTWRGAVACLALLFAYATSANDDLDEVNYILIEDYAQPEKSRLLVFNADPAANETDADKVTGTLFPTDADLTRALTLLQSVETKKRTRGLTLLAGMDTPTALHTAMTLLFDPDPAVREEALALSMQHPAADFELVAGIGLSDSSSRVRETAADLVAEREER